MSLSKTLRIKTTHSINHFLTNIKNPIIIDQIICKILTYPHQWKDMRHSKILTKVWEIHSLFIWQKDSNLQWTAKDKKSSNPQETPERGNYLHSEQYKTQGIKTLPNLLLISTNSIIITMKNHWHFLTIDTDKVCQIEKSLNSICFLLIKKWLVVGTYKMSFINKPKTIGRVQMKTNKYPLTVSKR